MNTFRKPALRFASLALATAVGLSSALAQTQQKSRQKPAQNSTEQDLPVPDVDSMPGGGPKYLQQMNAAPDGPPDKSGGNGQTLTFERKF